MYRFLKFTIGFLLKQFFSEIKIRGHSPQEHGPVIIVVNHPNLALDSLLIACSFKRDLWFIAKATLFANSIMNRFFTACHMLPIQRRQDGAVDSAANRDTFAKVVDKLCEGKAVAIFPEGASLGERKISPIKTGAARMSFEAEESRGFRLGMVIQPAGLTYSKLDTFGSSVTVTFGEPFKVTDLKSEYEKDAINAVRLLTDKIESEIKAVTVNIQDKEHIDLVEKITSIYKSHGQVSDDTHLMQTIAANVEKLGKEQLDSKKDLIERINVYCELASLFGVDGNFALDRPGNKLLMSLSLPLFVTGYLINIVPYRLVGYLVNKPEIHPVFRATNKFGYGILIFLVWYLLLSLSASVIGGSILYFFGVLILSAVSGIFINKYLNHLSLFIISNLWPVRKSPLDLLLMIRNDLITELNALRVE